MAAIQKGFTFTDGSTGNTAENLNALVDDATVLPGIIGDLPDIGGVVQNPNKFSLLDSSGALKSTTLSNLVYSFPGGPSGSRPDASIPALRQLGVLTGEAAAGDDSRFPTVLTGVRYGNGAGADTKATPPNLSFPSYALPNNSGTVSIDWTLSDLFYLSLTQNVTFTFPATSVGDGRVITVVLQLNGFTPTWPALYGATPATNPAATVHYYTFIKTAINPAPSGFVVAV